MQRLARDEVIERLRARLVEMTDDDHSICEIARQKNIFCRGFGRLSSSELRERYGWLEEHSHEHLTRPQLEAKANQWELARQIYHGVKLACDAEQFDRDQCTGWDGFSNEDLARFYAELFEESIEVVGEAPS